MASESERTQLTASEQSLREQLHLFKQERDRTENELRENLRVMKQELARTQDEWRSKCSQAEDSVKEMERRCFQAEKEHEQQKALLQQRISFTEKSLDEIKAKEQNYGQELKGQKKEHSSMIKEMHQRYEEQIKSLQSRLEFDQDKLSELERMLDEKEREFESGKIQWEETSAKQQSSINDLNKKVAELTKETQQHQVNYQQQIKDKQQDYQSQNNKLRARLEETETKLRSTEELFKQESQSWEKQEAVLKQKIEFYETSLEEMKQQLQETKKQQETMVVALQGLEQERYTDEDLQLAKEQYAVELQRIQFEFESQRVRQTQQLETLQEKNSELELKFKLIDSEKSELNDEIYNKQAAAQEEKQKFIDQIRKLEAKLAEYKNEHDKKVNANQKENQQVIASIQKQAQVEANEIRAQSEQSLANMKQLLEQDKQRVEKRVAEERERGEKKYNVAIEEYEVRIREIQEQSEEDIEILQEELNDNNGRLSQEIQKYMHQTGLDAQKIDSLEKQLKDTKENLNNIHSSNQILLEQQLSNFNKERAALLERLDKQAVEVANKEKVFSSLQYQFDQLKNLITVRDKEIEELRADQTNEKQLLIERLDVARAKNQQIEHEQLQKKVEFNKEIALANQQLEFQTKKIEDLQSQLEESNKKYESRLKQFRDQSGHELTESIARLTAEKEVAENKLEQKRKALKELEGQNMKQVNQLEREKAVFIEKLSHIENKLVETTNNHAKVKEELGGQLKLLRESVNQDKTSIQLENEKLKQALSELEKENAENKASYELEKTLWENRHNFLIQQRDSSRSDLIDAQKKFDQALEQIQKRGQGDKDKLESATSSLLSSVESRYTAQFREMTEQHQTIVNNTTEKNRSLDADLRNIKEEFERSKRNFNSENEAQNRKIKDLMDQEKRLLAELENIKIDRGKRLTDMQKAHEREKENIKQRLSDLELRAKDAEAQRAQLFIEFEKERAKWSLEKDHLMQQRNEAQDIVERLEKRKEHLLKENEKLRQGGRRPSQTGQFFKGKVVDLLGSMTQSQLTFEEFSKKSSDSTTPTRSKDGSPPPVAKKEKKFISDKIPRK